MKKRNKGTKKGIKKIKVDFNRFVESPVFQERIAALRKKYGIPIKGLNHKKDLFGKKRDSTFYPREWINYKDRRITKELSIDIKKVADLFPLHGFEWNNIVSTYLFLAYISEDLLEEHIAHDNLCKIVDLKAEFSEYGSSIINPVENEREKSSTYPIAIKITAYASRNTIVGFIDENLQQIKLLQNKYKDPKATLGKTRSRIAARKHEFIYKNRNKPRSVIARLTDQEFGGEHRPENMRVVISRKKPKG